MQAEIGTYVWTTPAFIDTPLIELDKTGINEYHIVFPSSKTTGIRFATLRACGARTQPAMAL